MRTVWSMYQHQGIDAVPKTVYIRDVGTVKIIYKRNSGTKNRQEMCFSISCLFYIHLR